jgi:hypothetical protein
VPFCATTAFHALVIRWLPANEKPSVQPSTVDVPVLVIETSAVKPSAQVLGR